MQYSNNYMMNGGAQMVNQYAASSEVSSYQQVQYMENMQQMPGQTVVQVQHVQPSPVMQTRNYTTSTTYQMPGASQTTAKFSSSRSGRIEPPKTFTVEEEYQEQTPYYPPVETHIVQQSIPMQLMGQQQVQYVEQQQQQQVQYVMAQPQVQYVEQPQVQYVEQVQVVQQVVQQPQVQYVQQVVQQPQVQYVQQVVQQPQVQYVQQQQVQCTQVVQPQVQVVQQQQYQLVEVEGPPQFVQVPGQKQIVEVPQPPILMEVEGPPQVVQLPSPRQLVQVPVGQTTTVHTSASPVVTYSSYSASSATTVQPSSVVTSVSSAVSPVTVTHSNASSQSVSATPSAPASRSITKDHVSFHVPPSVPGRSSLPVRSVTQETTTTSD